MNPTTPPPVEDLARADELRADLVRRARNSQRTRPTWIPVLAAACGIAVITTGVVVLTRPGHDDSAPPIASTPSSATTPVIREVRKVPADGSARVSLDLGPAGRNDALAAARECLAEGVVAQGNTHLIDSAGHDVKVPSPAEASTATVHDAHWIRTLPGYNRKAGQGKRALVQTFTTTKGVWVMCIDNHYQRISKDRRPGGDAFLSYPVNGQWMASSDPASGGKSTFYTDLVFDALPSVARVEVRLRWSGGASPWYGVTVKGGAGFVEASQLVHDQERAETDIRAFDASGKQVFADTQ
jgi:hypothetical protein